LRAASGSARCRDCISLFFYKITAADFGFVAETLAAGPVRLARNSETVAVVRCFPLFFADITIAD
jgi:hypothetical protein